MWILRYKKLGVLFIVSSLLYIAQSIFTKPDKAALLKYHLTAAHATAITLVVAIPYIIIWFIAFGGSARLLDYAGKIKDSKDGAAFKHIALGVLLLSAWLPLSTLCSTLAIHYYHLHPSATAAMVRLNNYVVLALLFPAFWIIYNGSERLFTVVKRPARRFPQLLGMFCVIATASYIFMTLKDPARQFPTHTVTVASYYVPDWVLLVTIIIPRLIMWLWGILAVYNIYLYRRQVRGKLYVSALNSLALGIGWVVASTIILRAFQSLSTQLEAVNLAAILLIIYALFGILAVGYGLIAQGSKKLQQLEEI